MLWIVQNNLYNEAGYVRFLEALDKLKVSYMVVKPVPFTNILLPAGFDSATQNVDDVEEPHVDTSQKVIAFGATSLSRISKAKGWSPGTYLNENFDFEVWRDGFGPENILSSDAIVGPVHSVSGYGEWDWVFVRPVHDTKSFSGMVMSKYDLQDWLFQISNIEEEEFVPLHRNTEIIVASRKEIYSECRVFVVDGKVATASMYKQGARVITSSLVDKKILDFAQKMIGKWQPAKAFVIDIAVTPKGMKIIEINNINSAGYYDADVQKIIIALEEMEK